MGDYGAWLGAITGLVIVGAASMMGEATHSSTTETSAAPTDSHIPTPPEGKRFCNLDRGGVQIAGKVAPGLAKAHDVTNVPIYRSYVPARVHLLACPATDDCVLQRELPFHLFTGVGPEPLHKHEAPPTVLSRGRCIEFEWSGKAETFWPHAPEGSSAGPWCWTATVGRSVPATGARTDWLTGSARSSTPARTGHPPSTDAASSSSARLSGAVS